MRIVDKCALYAPNYGLALLRSFQKGLLDLATYFFVNLLILSSVVQPAIGNVSAVHLL